MTTKFLIGRVQSGGPGSANPQLLDNVSVTLYEETAQNPLIIGSTTTNCLAKPPQKR